MIDNIKAMMQAKDATNEFNESLNSIKKEMIIIRTQMQSVTEELSKITPGVLAAKKQLQDEAADLRLTVEDIKDKTKDISDEMVSFKVAKAHQQDKLIDVFRKELRSETDKLKADVKNYNDLKKSLADLTQLMEMTKADLGAFERQAKKIGSMDYDLSKYARTLNTENQEKLRLLQRIDNLERLLAKERRKMPMRH